jgi:hypothetical protein
MPLQVPCPQCTKSVTWSTNNQFRPFCSERCQLIDLGDWADENHKITQKITVDSALSEEILDAMEDEFLQHNTFFVEPE